MLAITLIFIEMISIMFLEGVLSPLLSVFAIEISPKPYGACVLVLLPCLFFSVGFFLSLVALAMAPSASDSV